MYNKAQFIITAYTTGLQTK